MSSKPILFNSEMVRAILDGKKTQTRRVFKTKEGEAEFTRSLKPSPYGQVGDTLWVRETFYAYGKWVKDGTTKAGEQAYKFLDLTPENQALDYYYAATEKPTVVCTKIDKKHGLKSWFKRPSIFMPKWASRITLKITDIRVERVQDISERDAASEGVNTPYPPDETKLFSDYRERFEILWDSINAKRGYSWESNPYVWVVKFEVIK